MAVATHENPPSPSHPGADRFGFIEGMRGLAALYVVLQHICTMIDPHMRFLRPGAQPQWLASMMSGLWYGHFAVAAFIVLSGFCLQMSLYLRGDGRISDLGVFLRRRCWRILPPYYACLALSLVTCHFVTSRQEGMPWSQYLPVTSENVWAHVLMVHNLRPEWMYKINGVLWSISIEFQLYFLFPVLAWMLWRWGAKLLLPVTVLTVAAVLFVYPSSEKLYLWYAALFALGMAGARWAFDPRLERPSAPAMLLVAAFALGLALQSIGWTKELVWRDTLMGVAVVAILAAGTLTPNALWVRVLSLRPLVWLGAFSYSLYLMHHPILQWLFVYRPEWFSTPTRQFGFLVATLPVILGLCWLFYLCFEKPFIGRGKKRKPPPLDPDQELRPSTTS